jgi:MOSC domain-containing protein YiiM
MGHIHQINISNGGVPKLPVLSAVTTELGIEGDSHNDKIHHGGPERALCLYSLEQIEELQNEGHPIFPGAIGENITTSGIDLHSVHPGVQLQLGNEVLIEVTSYTAPCRIIDAAFASGAYERVSQKLHPGWSRLYARVIRSGIIRVTDSIIVHHHISE